MPGHLLTLKIFFSYQVITQNSLKYFFSKMSDYATTTHIHKKHILQEVNGKCLYHDTGKCADIYRVIMFPLFSRLQAY